MMRMAFLLLLLAWLAQAQRAGALTLDASATARDAAAPGALV